LILAKNLGGGNRITNWIENWDAELEITGRKVLLLLDNCKVHPPAIREGLKNIEIMFLPVNTTAKSQVS
jgi:hypothetical protein